MKAVHEGGCFVIRGEFRPAESRLYVLHDTIAPALGSVDDRPAVHPDEFKPYTALGPIAEFKRTAPNAFLLDVCQYRIGSERWSAPKEVWRAQKELRERLGMRTVHANGNLQRHLWVHEPHPKDGEPVCFRFQFEVTDAPAGQVRLALEQGEQYAVTLNGQSAGLDGGWYMDRCMKTFVLPDVRRGINELELFCAYTARFELEDAFLLGDFAVDEQRTLINEPDKLRFGDWCLQGYPHYCGSMRYALDVELEAVDSHRYLLEIGAIQGVLAVLYINGSLVRKLPWQSEYALEISEAVFEGRNQIEVEVVGSPRNLLGPVHLARTDDTWEDWWSYRPEGADYTSEYVLQPYGLMSQIHIRRCAK